MKQIETANTRHVVIKDLNRRGMFYESADYHGFLRYLCASVHRHAGRLHAYALLPDHVHLLLSASRHVHLVKMLEQSREAYAGYFNFTHRRIWKKLEPDCAVLLPVADYRLLVYYRYIELAPVRQGLVNDPGDYPWTSYGCNAMGEDTGILSPHEAYLGLGVDEPARRRRYRGLFTATADSEPGGVPVAPPVHA